MYPTGSGDCVKGLRAAAINAGIIDPMKGPMTPHSESCLRSQAEREAQRQKWLTDWPNHCRNCFGEGGNMVMEEDDYGEPHESFDACICNENGKCPRCGAVTEDV